MISFRPADTRGFAEHGWLDSHHSFSFGSWHDPAYMGIGALRVLNDDRVVGGAGFPPHSHRDMEIITYVLGGALRHKDSTGGSSDLKPGELQVMTAGRGIAHSEMNADGVKPVHFLQIWIEPSVRGAAPGYQQQALDIPALKAGFSLVAAPEGEAAPFRLLQDARLSIAWPSAGQQIGTALRAERQHYLHVARGAVLLGDQPLNAGDAALLTQESRLALTATADAELLLFDLAA
ncbi:MAG: pirin family protein [Nevskia sp.]|jgi:redox-sensitive bicupin YhaK (pirin superfamily)|uniref:pirin family protein n=1 Tax=Nevskia sp. TaxID=1929292 RepID=UPI0040375261